MEKYQQVEYVNFIKDLCETRDRNLAAMNGKFGKAEKLITGICNLQ